MPLICTPTRTEPQTQACALTGNQTGDLWLCGMVASRLNHTGQAPVSFLVLGMELFSFFLSPDITVLWVQPYVRAYLPVATGWDRSEDSPAWSLSAALVWSCRSVLVTRLTEIRTAPIAREARNLFLNFYLFTMSIGFNIKSPAASAPTKGVLFPFLLNECVWVTLVNKIL